MSFFGKMRNTQDWKGPVGGWEEEVEGREGDLRRKADGGGEWGEQLTETGGQHEERSRELRRATSEQVRADAGKHCRCPASSLTLRCGVFKYNT